MKASTIITTTVAASQILPYHPQQFWHLYKQRANCENRIKELKYNFGADNFNLQSFDATEAALKWVMMAYDIISLFRQVVLNTKVEQPMKTLRYNVFCNRWIYGKKWKSKDIETLTCYETKKMVYRTMEL